jgi:ligand-binding sensor domain-containing protein
MWGLHRQRSDGSFVTVEDLPFRVRALDGIGPVLWVGTDSGVYSVSSGQEKHREPDWPYDQVVSLTVEPATGSKWLVTRRGVGRIIDNAWQPLSQFPLQVNELLADKRKLGRTVSLFTEILGENQTWAAGGGDPDRGIIGLYRIGLDEYECAFGANSEDTLSNAVQCLWVDDTTVWVGTARGLCSFDKHNRTWRNFRIENPDLQDVRAIVPGQTREWLWVGSGQSGFHRLRSGTHLPNMPSPKSIVAMVAGDDGTLWAATPEEVLCLAPNATDWEPTDWPTSRPTIQTLCATNDALWVGTAEGLWRYRPDLKLWPRPAEDDTLRHLPIQALAVDPSGSLWVGTKSGLYSLSGNNWVRFRKVQVGAMAFAPEGTLWLGTTTGLERWSSPGDSSVFNSPPMACFLAGNSGLAADLVTALAVHAAGNKRQVWIGSPGGVSCYEYTS